MFSVKLFAPKDVEMDELSLFDVIRMAQWAGSKCYNEDHDAQFKNFEKINVEQSLWKTGHHTTIQHAPHYLTFDIENIPVSMVTFGLHMTHPFYNSSQRSGRFCLDIFGKDESSYVEYINSFLSRFFPHCKNPESISDWFLSGLRFFNDNIDEATTLVRKSIDTERPNYLLNKDILAKRMAQDFMRVFISTIVPTGLVYTINIPTLYAMCASAWNGPMIGLMDQLEDTFSTKYNVSFKKQIRQTHPNYVPDFLNFDDFNNCVVNRVNVELSYYDKYVDRQIEFLDAYHKDAETSSGSIDTLFFNPLLTSRMNDDSNFGVTVDVPTVTYGQDQRHRTIRRSNPSFTGMFYVSELINTLPGVRKFAQSFMMRYKELVLLHGKDMMLFFAPYGAVVRYTKECDARAYVHAINKRLCFNAEKTIHDMEVATLAQISGSLNVGPPCFNGSCKEGNRFCGRNVQDKKQRSLI